MKLLLVIDEMESIAAGGTERQILQIATLTRNAGIDVEFAVFRGTEWLRRDHGDFVVHELGFERLSSLLDLKKIWAFIKLLKCFDIVQSFFVEANIVTPVMAWVAGVPVRIGSRRNLNHWMTRKVRLLQSFSNLFVTRLAANCDAVRQKIEATELFSKGKIDVIYNGLDTEQFRPDPAARMQQRAALGISPGEIVIGNTSTLRAPKGVDDFLRAAGLVVKAVPAKFLLVGDGPLRGELERLAAQLGIAERTIFAGAQTDVRPWLAAMDIAVMSSHAEGFSNSILEYMACGLPSVVSDVGGNAEAVRECGIVTPAGDVPALSVSILKLAQSQELRERLGAGARNRALLFSLPATQKALLDHYRKLRMAG